MPPRQRPAPVTDPVPGDDRDRPNSRGAATRLQIVETAERLFAERGIESVPLRDIAVAAGQKNNAAVQYHFGDRAGLLKAILAHRATRSEQVRSELFADLIVGDSRPTVRDLVRAFVLSLAGHVEEDSHYLAFLSRHIIEHGGYSGLEGAVGESVVATFVRVLADLLPEIPRPVLDERWLVVMTTCVHTLSRYQIALHAGSLPAPLDELLDDLVDFLAAGVEAARSRR